MRYRRVWPRSTRGLGQLDMLLGLSLGLGVLGMAVQAWGQHRQWSVERDLQQELFGRTPSLHRLLLRLSRQAGSRPLRWDGTQWQVAASYVALPAGAALTWVHARDIHALPALYPNCQNTRIWANDAALAPLWLRDQFSLVNGQLKCKDTAQAGANWQSWVERVHSSQGLLAWKTGTGAGATWRWRLSTDTPTTGRAQGARLCLVLDSATPSSARPRPGPDCLGRPLPEKGRAWWVWSRTWALRVNGS